MKLPPSRILSLLRENRYPAVLKLNLIDPRVAEVAGASGIDALWLCQEHVPNDWLNLEHMIRAARIHGIDTLVRVAKGGYSNAAKGGDNGNANRERLWFSPACLRPGVDTGQLDWTRGL